MSHRPLLVTAHLAGPLAGDPPRLDALLEYCLSLHRRKGEAGHEIDRKSPAPEQGEIPIPVYRERLGACLKARCSDPIAGRPSAETVEHINKRIGVERSGMLAESERRVIATGNSWTKSCRLPLRVRVVGRVAWFAAGDRREVLKVLRRVPAVGKKVADGYGRVREWTVEAIGEDRSWFAPSGAGPVLMATLPVGPWLPDGLVGARRDFGAASPPYWHPDRYTEVVVPA